MNIFTSLASRLHEMWPASPLSASCGGRRVKSLPSLVRLGLEFAAIRCSALTFASLEDNVLNKLLYESDASFVRAGFDVEFILRGWAGFSLSSVRSACGCRLWLHPRRACRIGDLNYFGISRAARQLRLTSQVSRKRRPGLGSQFSSPCRPN